MSLILHQEMRKWRNKLTDVCRQFLELSPPERLDNGHFKEYFIRMTSDRLRRTTERYDSEKFTRKERCRPNKHSDGASQMIAHLDRIEHATRIFLNSANTQLDNDFMRYFCRQSEESISEAYDIFSSALKYGAYGTNGTSKDEQHTNKLTKRIANKRKASTSSVEEENMKEKRKKTHASSQSSRENHNSKLFSIMKNFFEIWQSGLKSSMHSKGSTKNDRKNKENVSKRSIEQKHNKINETGAGTSKQSLHRTSGNKRPKGLGHDQKKTSRDVIDKERSKDVRCLTETRHTKANRTGTGSSKKSLNRTSGDERPKGSGREKSKDSRKDAKTGPLQLNNNPSNPKSLQYDQKKTSRDAIVKERSKDVRCTSNTRHTEANRTEKSKDSRNGANTEHFHRNKSPSKQSDPKKTSQNGIKQKAGEKQSHSLKHSEPTKSDKIRAKSSVQKTVLAQTSTTNCAVKLQAGSLVYHCFYCKDANEPTLFHSENDLYSHWLSAHNSSRTQPFQFYAVETVICYRCGEVGTFEELTNHYSQRHRDEVFVILRKGAEKCALCDYGGKWMNIHFKAEHRIQSKPKRLQSDPNKTSRDGNRQNESIFNPVKMSMDSLHQLGITNNTNEIDHFFCCQQRIELIDLLDHMQHHGNVCSICHSFEATDMIEILKHIREAHGDNEPDIHLTNFVESLRKEFYETQVVFANGLVLFNRNLVGSQHDPIHDFIGCVKEWINVLKMEFQQEIQNKYILKVVFPWTIGEDVKLIFGNLYRALGVKIDQTDVMSVKRTASKRAIAIECRCAKVKEDIIRQSSVKGITVSDLIDTISTYTFPPNMITAVTFE